MGHAQAEQDRQRTVQGLPPAAPAEVPGRAGTVSRSVEVSRVQVEPGVFDVTYSDGSTRYHINLTACAIRR